MIDAVVPALAALALVAVTAQAALHLTLTSRGVYLAGRGGSEKQSTELQDEHENQMAAIRSEARLRERLAAAIHGSTEPESPDETTPAREGTDVRQSHENRQDRSVEPPPGASPNPRVRIFETRTVAWVLVSALLILSLTLGW